MFITKQKSIDQKINIIIIIMISEGSCDAEDTDWIMLKILLCRPRNILHFKIHN